jgi:lysophospholipid acyltransferase (LPLAT)-like uncharacterized protein|tara:strand:- start:420 stop:1094 length:675 start_codon:yes stop_codon:yes gene_type:complete
MNPNIGAGKGNLHHQSLLRRILVFPLGIVYRLWTFSVRMHYTEERGLKEMQASDLPVVITLWHNRLFLAGEWVLRFRKKRGCYGLISGSRDGAWLQTFYGWAGVRAIRGSRNRRGTQAVRELVKVVKKGHDVGITPDGSRGPCYEAKPGALVVAKLAKIPVLLLSFEYSACIRLQSWDRFVLPYPFSSVRVTTRMLHHDELFAERNLEEATHFVESELNRLTID